MHHYEQLELWKRGIALSGRLHRAARAARGNWSDRALWDQISRAATSIPANVAEGALRGSDREFARFLSISMGSAAELHSLIDIAAVGGVLDPTEARTLIAEVIALRRMASALRARANGNRPRTQSSPLLAEDPT
ncbi:MAG TPA: four helix bundle protein [Gemmatimonadaceae bacterium]|jgi:four helix bundle protein